MTARISIDRDDIVAAALAIVRESGWEGVSARSIAARLGSSTMPIYSGMGSMDELRRLAAQRAESMLEDAQGLRRTDNPTLDLAVGYVAFAREEPRLFHFALGSRAKDSGTTSPAGDGDHPAHAALSDGNAAAVRGRKDVESLLSRISGEAGKGDFLLRSWVFTHGLAELLAAGVLVMDDAEILRHLMAAGSAFYRMHAGKDGEA